MVLLTQRLTPVMKVVLLPSKTFIYCREALVIESLRLLYTPGRRLKISFDCRPDTRDGSFYEPLDQEPGLTISAGALADRTPDDTQHNHP